ncbi:hypothetical protein P8935_17395 [Telmatobacter sp. DSM 110680]|uniref:Uncharacterized protein n=1 Tax=Telmatobacter sp. DSM 110680 TaxID=3036704 RepID=A0AAU7DHR4_9BACT
MIRPSSSSSFQFHAPVRLITLFCAGLALSGVMALAQAITIDTKSGANHGNGTVDRRYAQIKPTNVPLDKSELDAKTRTELIRVLQAEQGFAMRPFPMGHKGLTLVANGELTPAGEPYLDMVTANGICAKPGDRVVLTDVKFDRNKIVFELNGGPDLKHRFLRHVQIGAGGGMTNPVVQDNGEQATGARLTLEFKGRIPELTGSQVKALLTPLISFDVKTPIQAFTDTLPPKLKEAILDHNVMVGMSTDMVLFAMGQPQRKVREVDGQTPFEEWIYGAPPNPVQFVRINGNRVIRVEIAKVGESPRIFTKDEVDGLMRTDGTPLVAEEQHTRTVKMGDVTRDPDKEAPAPPPTLTAPGEKLPDNAAQQSGVMKPVEFPKQKPDDYPDVEAARRADQAKAAEAADAQKASDTGAGTAKPATSQGTTPSSATSPAPDSTQPH